ncbi:MAG TPA: DUF5916 domain-containing protein [Longimicrobiaceae bacterium]|nr:DUF5916 domain-containing protein [Longimicrobiaceae bacterium]
MPRLFVRAALLAAALGAAAAAPLAGQAHPRTPPEVRAVPRTGPVAIDGRLDEALWRTAPAATGFTQQDPDEGKPATQPTEVRFAYDGEALYVGARMFDSLGARGVRSRLARRDQQEEGDYLELVFDTFHDHTGRTVLRVNPAGIKTDAGQAAAYADPSWDPVWEAAARVDSLGWTAELRIPFSQLRYARGEAQSWGVQLWRFTERLNERSMWAFWGKEEAGGPQRFGHLQGLRLTARRAAVELLPYLVSRAEYVRPDDPESPFADPSDYGVRAGGDVKAVLTSTLTLDATINPDFGQVEVDPAVVNLSAFETFFPERRPFFVEGSGLFDFGDFGCFVCSDVSSLSLFYSRRIGRFPQGSVTDPAEFVDVPENTTILGAAKLTGRTRGGLQVGVLNALTARERARAQGPDGRVFRQEVEPLTNYFVGRVKRNLREGSLVLGAIGTSVVRGFGDDALRALLPAHAEAVGVDWNASWRERTYTLLGNFALSQVSGDSAAILRLQESSARYFQRPDRDPGGNGFFSDAHDPGATVLRGFGGYLRAAKDAGSWLWEASVNYRSPGFEVNDLAFLTEADYVWMNANLLRQWTRPTRWFRGLVVNAGLQRQYNFDGDLTGPDYHAYGSIELPNYWEGSLFALYRPESLDDRLTRGGPVVRRAASVGLFPSFETDSRRPVVLEVAPSWSRTAEGAESWGVELEVRYKPASNVELSLEPGYSRDRSAAQFVRTFADPAATHFHGRRVVFAELDQHTLGLDLRLAATFTPTLTLEVFAQPFVATGDFSGFKEFRAPRTREKVRFDTLQLRPVRAASGRDSVYVLDPDRNPATADFSFRNPDFNERSLRGNAVLRWEYRPGSTLYLVWQQERSGAALTPFDFGDDAPGVFDAHPDNIFLVKVSYWFGR